jgi:uncharacterized membrane protein YeaQ/YmgE (transglycosylase-associated protein family)
MHGQVSWIAFPEHCPDRRSAGGARGSSLHAQHDGTHFVEGGTMVMNILMWIVFGLIAGVVAKFIGKERERVDPAGLVGTGLLGIVGAVVGGYLSSRLFGWDVNSFSILGLVVAVAGALLLLFLYRFVMGARRAY